MRDALRVQVLHGQAELAQELAHHALGETAPGTDQLRQVAARAQLHHDVHVTDGGANQSHARDGDAMDVSDQLR